MIVVVGLSHRTAPIEVREKLVIEQAGIAEFLRELVTHSAVSEALLVSTCNRVELVAAGRSGSDADLHAAVSDCVLALARRAPGIDAHLYRHTGGTAVRHLFRVAASLDSLVLGEPQILGQVKDGYELARSAGTVGSVLHRTLPRAIRAAKRVRTETTIGSGQVSVPSVAIDLARQIFGELKKHSVLLVGSGEMAESVAKLLRGAGASVFVLGRNAERVAELARAVDGTPRTWADLKTSLVEADVVITSTSAPNYVIDYEMVASLRKSRRGRSQFFIDLAVPRDVEPRIENLDGTFVYNIDDFSRVVSETLSARSREAERAEAIVAREAQGFDRWADAEQATPTIVALRARLRAALEAEVSRSLRGRLKHLSADDRLALTIMVEAALNRLLHGPSVRLRQAAIERGTEGLTLSELTTALDELFGLSSDAQEELAAAEEMRSDPEGLRPDPDLISGTR